jgi:hypothetical protein
VKDEVIGISNVKNLMLVGRYKRKNESTSNMQHGQEKPIKEKKAGRI